MFLATYTSIRYGGNNITCKPLWIGIWTSPNIPKFFEPFVNENILRIFNNYINKYQIHNEALFNSSRGENAIIVNENLVFDFLARKLI